MGLVDTLRQARDQVLDEAFEGIQNAPHYERHGEIFTRVRLGELFDLVVEAVDRRELTDLGTYVETIATQRFSSGFDISEVQAAFNALELAMWRRVVASTSHDELVEAIGIVGTVMGVGKDLLARRYISLASERHVPTLDMSALFEGAGS